MRARSAGTHDRSTDARPASSFLPSSPAHFPSPPFPSARQTRKPRSHLPHSAPFPSILRTRVDVVLHPRLHRTPPTSEGGLGRTQISAKTPASYPFAPGSPSSSSAIPFLAFVRTRVPAPSPSDPFSPTDTRPRFHLDSGRPSPADGSRAALPQPVPTPWHRRSSSRPFRSDRAASAGSFSPSPLLLLRKQHHFSSSVPYPPARLVDLLFRTPIVLLLGQFFLVTLRPNALFSAPLPPPPRSLDLVALSPPFLRPFDALALSIERARPQTFYLPLPASPDAAPQASVRPRRGGTRRRGLRRLPVRVSVSSSCPSVRSSRRLRQKIARRHPLLFLRPRRARARDDASRSRRRLEPRRPPPSPPRSAVCPLCASPRPFTIATFRSLLFLASSAPALRRARPAQKPRFGRGAPTTP